MLVRTLLTICAIVIPSTSACATQVLALELSEMVNVSHVIAYGTVTSQKSERPDDAPGRIHTAIQIKINKLLKSDRLHGQSKTLEFVVPGGRIGRIGQVVSGAPKFSNGEEVILLLSRQPRSERLIIVGFSQGQYRIKRKVSPLHPTATSPRQGTQLLKRDSTGRLQPLTAHKSPPTYPLEELLSSIRGHLKNSE